MPRFWILLKETIRLFSQIDGEQRAASFAYYAFFSLFPLVLLFVSIAALFVESQAAAERIISAIITYIPLEREMIARTIYGVIRSRGQVGVIALIGLLWSAMRFFQALVIGINRAWEETDTYTWWRLSLKNLSLLGIVGGLLLLGILAGMVLDTLVKYAPQILFLFLRESLLRLFRFLLPLLILFSGFMLLYKLAPRRKVPFSDVWLAAGVATLMLRLAQFFFILYVERLGNFNAIYGTLGSIIVLLMWIYLSGMIIILGGCLSVAYARIYGSQAKRMGRGSVSSSS